MLELMDFLADLRQALGDGEAIELMPVGDGDREVWRKKLATSDDPWLRLVSETSDTPIRRHPASGGAS
jgi:hypothetical protein